MVQQWQLLQGLWTLPLVSLCVTHNNLKFYFLCVMVLLIFLVISEYVIFNLAIRPLSCFGDSAAIVFYERYPIKL